MRFSLLSSLALIAVQALVAADKSDYTLFHPVPEAELRDFNTDRPDKTNGSVTLDAGHLQFETDIFSYTRDGHGASKQETRMWANSNLRIGLLNSADLQLMVPWSINDGTHTGIGDLTIALKTNFWGNDGGDSAAAFEALLSVPTGAHSVSAGTEQATFLAIYEHSLGSFDAGFNTGVSIVANDDGDSHHTEIVNSISIGHDLVGPLSAYVEFFSSVPTSHSHDWIGTIDTGVLWQVAKNFQLDAGINIGVTHAADDLQVFVGASYRL